MATSGMDALLDATRDWLRQSLQLSHAECDVTPDGQPHPGAGQRFVAVWPGGVTNQQNHCLDERYSVRVTVTVRTAMNPRDRKRDGGAWALALEVRAKVHMSYDLTALATAADAGVVFTEPLVFQAGTYKGPVGPEWFWADPTGTNRDPTGIAVELNFGRARRLQYIDDQRV